MNSRYEKPLSNTMMAYGNIMKIRYCPRLCTASCKSLSKSDAAAHHPLSSYNKSCKRIKTHHTNQCKSINRAFTSTMYNDNSIILSSSAPALSKVSKQYFKET